MNDYHAVTFAGDPESLGIVQAMAGTWPVLGILEDGPAVTLYFDDASAAAEAERGIGEYLDSLGREVSVKRTEIHEQNWNEEFERSLEPVRIAEGLVIRQSWNDAPFSDDDLVITIDPKMSFGTGHHESTRLIARLMPRERIEGRSVLDIGTGTGILAILAAKLGAGRICAFDNNEWAVANAAENLRLNDVADRVDLSNAELEEIDRSTWDIVLANLHTNLIIRLLPIISSIMSDSGTLLTSGVVLDDYERLKDATRDAGLALIGEERENEWVASRFGIGPAEAGDS